MSRTTRKRPLIGCTTYRKTADADPPIELIGVRPAYVEAIVAAGGIPLLIPLGLEETDLLDTLAQVDGLLVPGGGDIDPILYHGLAQHATIAGVDPDRDRVEFALVRAAVRWEKPVLAICRGHQVFNVALGGTLWEDIYSQMPSAIRHDYYRSHPLNYPAHTIQIEPESVLARSLGKRTTMVNSLHHQGIRQLATQLAASAFAPDGLIEAVEVRGHRFAVGVQWHPENLVRDDPTMLSLFECFVAAAAQ